MNDKRKHFTNEYNKKKPKISQKKPKRNIKKTNLPSNPLTNSKKERN